MTGVAVRIPRGTCRLFGAIRAIGTIRNSVILVHGPKGCVYHINYILGMRGDRPSEIYSTCLDEKDVIFGAEQKLSLAIEELDRDIRPELIFVLSCCASSIIGEDVFAAIRETRTAARCIGIDAGGFEGDFRTGYGETLRRLVEELAEETDAVDPRSVNLIGLLRGGPDAKELERILSLIDVKVNSVLTADTTLERIRKLGSAALNVVVCETSGKDAAEALQKKFGTPYIIEEIPIGHGATRRFLKDVAEKLGIPETAGPATDQSVLPDCSSLRDRRIAIVSGPTRAISIARFFMDLGIVPRLIAVDFDGNVKEKLEPLIPPETEVLIEPDQDQIIRALREHRIDLVIGGMLEQPVAKALGIEHIDVMHGSQRTVGFDGAEHLVKLLLKRNGRRQGHGGN
jgi:nitrogenase molybdenum-cofactor synthesis protein NifE